jgi:large subunit ribosomal protein L13
MIIDATNMIVGRIATVAAKSALLGEKVDVINCENAVVSGARARVLADNRRMRAMGTPSTGPYIKRKPSLYVKRIIRGMLPYKQPKGRDALERIKCHIGVPSELEGKETVKIEKADSKKLPIVKYVTVGEICKLIGGRE